jgi:hypothetical protein
MENMSESGNFEIDGNNYTKEELLNLYRLQKQLLLKENIIATLSECANIWSNYSNDLAASWLFFPDKDEYILAAIKGSESFTSYKQYSL